MPTLKQLSRILSSDDALNRVQDQLASALNPILRNVQGDLTGPLESPTVKGLRGIGISQVAPTTGQSLIYDGTEWAPAIGGGGISSVTPPLDLTAGVLSIPAADGTTDGYLTSADWLTFDGKVSSVAATSPLASSGGTTPTLSMTQADATTDGWLSSTDWNTFNNKAFAGDPTVVLLVAMTGTAGSTDFPDTSYEPATLTANGAAAIAATPSKFGGGSGSFNGSSAYITAPSAAAYNFGTGDFTLEAWVYLSAMSGDYFVLSAAGSGGLFFGFRSGTNLGIGRAGVAWDYDTPSGITTGGWYHVAVCRSGTSVRLFVDGNQVGTTQTLTHSYNLGVTNLCIGSQGGSFLFNGYMDDVRASNVARYTANFTPPAAPFPAANPPWSNVGVSGPAGGVLYGTYPNPSAIQATSTSGTSAYVPVLWNNSSANTWLFLDPGPTPASIAHNLGLIGPPSAGSMGPGGAVLKGGLWTSLIGNQAGGPATVIGGDGSIGGLGVLSGPGGDAYLLGGTGGDAASSVDYGAGGHARVRGGTGYDPSITTLWGNVYVGDTNTAGVYVAASGVKTRVQGPTVFVPPATQNIVAATADFAPNRTLLPFEVSGGTYTLTSTPTVLTAGAVAGQTVVLMNVGTVNYIEVQRGATYGLKLAAATRKIDAGGSLVLVFDGTYWTEVMWTETTSI